MPELWGQLEPIYRHVLDAGEAVRNVPFTRPDDEGRPHQEWLASFYPVRIGGEVIGVGVVTVDVTERVHAERFRSTVMSQVADGVYTQDAEGRLTYMNRAASKMLGWTEEELRGRPMHDVVHFQRADGSPVAAEECALMTEGPTTGSSGPRGRRSPERTGRSSRWPSRRCRSRTGRPWTGSRSCSAT